MSDSSISNETQKIRTSQAHQASKTRRLLTPQAYQGKCASLAPLRLMTNATIAFCCLLVFAKNAMAQANPILQPFEILKDLVAGPLVRALAIICVVVTGIAIAFDTGGHEKRRIIYVLIGLSVALSSAAVLGAFFA